MTEATLRNTAEKDDKFLILPIIVLILAQMGTSGDIGALSLAASALQSDLGASLADIQLANMAYSLVAGAFMTTGGLMGTIIGWKKNFRMGALFCALGEVVLAFAPTMAIFTWVGRVMVGFGASFMIPSVLGLVPKIYFGKNRALAFGCIGAASGLSALLPLILGGVMQYGGMKVTFLVLSVYFLLVFIFSFKLPQIDESGTKSKFDTVGVVLAAAGLFMFLVGIAKISTWGLWEPFAGAPSILGISPALPIAGTGIVILAILLMVEKTVEKKHGSALIPQSFLHTPQVLAGLAASAIAFFFVGVQAILLGPYLQLVAGWTPVQVGISSIVVGMPTFVFSMGIPKFLPQANPRHVIQVGYLVMATALMVMASSVTIDGASTMGIFAGCVLAGSGTGIVSSHANNVVALAVNDRDASQSGGIQTTMRNVGQAIGIAFLGAVLLFSITDSVNAGAQTSDILSDSTKAIVAQIPLSLNGDAEFTSQLVGAGIADQAEIDELIGLNKQARFSSTRLAYGVGATIILLGLFTTPAIKIFKK